MALVVDVINRRGPSNETRRQLQPKKSKLRLRILTVYIDSSKAFCPPFKMTRFGFKSGCVVHVENGKMHHQL